MQPDRSMEGETLEICPQGYAPNKHSLQVNPIQIIGLSNNFENQLEATPNMLKILYQDSPYADQLNVNIFPTMLIFQL